MPLIKLTKRQIKALRAALYFAVEWEQTTIDSYQTGLKWGKNRAGQKAIVSYIPKEWKKEAGVSLRRIERFKELSELLRGELR